MTRWQLWWRTCRFGPLLMALVTLALAQRWIPSGLLAPQLRALEDTDVPTATFLSAAVGITIAYQVPEPVPTIWRLATRRAQLRGRLRALVCALVYLGITAVLAPTWAATATNVTLTAFAETLLLLQMVDRRLAWAVPAVHCALSALLGRQLFGQLSWWAWPADPRPSTEQILIQGLLTLVVLAGLRAGQLRPR